MYMYMYMYTSPKWTSSPPISSNTLPQIVWVISVCLVTRLHGHPIQASQTPIDIEGESKAEDDRKIAEAGVKERVVQGNTVRNAYLIKRSVGNTLLEWNHGASETLLCNGLVILMRHRQPDRGSLASKYYHAQTGHKKGYGNLYNYRSRTHFRSQFMKYYVFI